MKRISKVTLSVLISLSTFACSTQTLTTNPEQKAIVQNQETGKVSVNVDTRIPKSFSTKALDFSKTTKLKLEVRASDLTEPVVSPVVAYTQGQPTTINVSVKAGKNRVAILYMMDDYENIVGTLMGALDVTAGQTNPATISFFETSIAQILLGIMSSANAQILNTLSLTELRNYVTNVTGYIKASNSFSKINPAQLNSAAITTSITANNGTIPPETLANLSATKDLTVNLNTNGAKIMINDLNSTALNNTTTNSVVLSGVTYGKWKLTVMKDGYKTTSMDVNVTPGTDPNININLSNYFANYVAVGDSLTAGYQSGAVQKDKQLKSYPMMIAMSGNVAQADFKQPYIAEPGTGYGFGGADSQGFYGELTATGTRQRLSVTQAQLPSILEAVNEPAPYNNLGIAGAKLEEVVSTKLNASNPFFGFVLRNKGLATDTSELDQAVLKQPSLLTVWAGNNDVLGAATGGNSTSVTPTAQFTTSYNNMISRLITQTSADIFVSTIPDVTTIPYTSTMVTKRFTNNNTNLPVVDVPTGNPNQPIVESTIPTQEANVKYILINALGVIPTLQAGQSLAGQYTLTETEVAQLKETVDAYNATIKAAVAANPRLTLVDMNKVLTDINAGLVAGASSKVYLLDPNTMFSYDSVHPNSKGYRVVAGEFVKAINKKYGFNLALPN